MKCQNVVTQNGKSFACGACTPCKIKRGQTWSIRQILESQYWSTVPGRNIPLFITLTYDDDNLPLSPNGYPNLQYSDVQKFHKRLRIHGLDYRHYTAGEYGTSETKRPHYHMNLFGLEEAKALQLSTKFKNTSDDRKKYGKELRLNPLHLEGITKLIHHVWGKGRVDVQPIMKNSYGYVAGYVTKHEHTKKGLYEKSGLPDDDRTPEFSHQSRKPPIGCWPEDIQQLSNKLLLTFQKVRKHQGHVDQEELTELFHRCSELAKHQPNFAEESISILHQDGTLLVNDLLLFFAGYVRYEKKMYPLGRTIMEEIYKQMELSRSGLSLVSARRMYHQVKEKLPTTQAAIQLVIDQVDKTDKDKKLFRKKKKAREIGKKNRGAFINHD